MIVKTREDAMARPIYKLEHCELSTAFSSAPELRRPHACEDTLLLLVTSGEVTLHHPLRAGTLRAGDVAVFSPELSAQTLSDWFGAETMWQAAEEQPGLLARLDPSRREALLAAFPRFAAQKASFLLNGSAPDGDGVYASASFTARGDILPELREENRMPTILTAPNVPCPIPNG